MLYSFFCMSIGKNLVQNSQFKGVGSSFRRFTLWQIGLKRSAHSYVLVVFCTSWTKKNPLNQQNFKISIVLSGFLYRWGNGNNRCKSNKPRSQYSIECTRGIGFASIVTVLLPLKTKYYTNVCIEFVLQSTWNLVKKTGWQTDISLLNCWF